MLELKGLRKTFHDPNGGDWRLADHLNLTVSAGKTVAILGPSGSGKSTLLKMVAGLEPLDGGRVFFAGQDITVLPPEQRRFALMFQDFALFPHLDVQDNVAFGLIEQRVSRSIARRRAFDLLALFGLAARARQTVWTLSGGEQQRVALARAFVTRPALLFADEPTGNLDTRTGEAIIELLFGLNAEAGTTLVLVTHDARLAERCDRQLRLDSSRLVSA